LNSFAATIGIIDTGFDLDHDFLRPKILKQETDEEAINPNLKTVRDWRFHDNSHLKEPVIKDKSLLQEVLLYRNLRAKGHREGLSLSEFEWFKNKSSDQEFMNQVKIFKKHAHGTFVAGIALREGENINLFPIRGLNLPSPIIAVNANSKPQGETLKSSTPEDKFNESLKQSEDRVVKKFAKICKYLSLNGIDIVNASYGITYKNITSRFREKYKEFVGSSIEESRLESLVRGYFNHRILFVFSAGNSGLDNDQYPHYPSKIKLPNTLTVGAMNGDFLASFSNFGKNNVDIGAPGVAILSLVPSAYTVDGKNIYSPSSGTSMAAPYISNLAAQILNINLKLLPDQIKKIILETGDEKDHLKEKMVSSSIVNNERAIKAAFLSKDLPLEQAITLAKTGLVPIEDTVSFGQPPAIEPAKIQQKVMDSIPQTISPQEIEEIQSTSDEMTSEIGPEKKNETTSPQAPAQ
jgi:subtilisin family serine protease